MLKDWMREREVKFTEFDLSQDPVKRDEVIKKTGQMAVPIVEIDNDVVIGFDRKRLSQLLDA
jgi:glutaredoxin